MKRIMVWIVAAALMLSVAALAESATSELQSMYAEAELLMARGEYAEAGAKFEALGVYSDASQMAMYCKAIYAAEQLGMYDVAVMTFDQLGDFRDSVQMAKYYAARRNEAVADTVDAETARDTDISAAIFGYKEAEKGYTELALFKDCMTRLVNCGDKRGALEAEQKRRIAADKEANYQRALSLEADGKYQEAIKVYDTIKGYKDVTERIEACRNAIKEGIYQSALALENEGKYEEAIEAYETIEGYKDAARRIEACENAIKEGIYQSALTLEDEGKYEEAIKAFNSIKGYKDAVERIEACKSERLANDPLYAIYRAPTEMTVEDIDLHSGVHFGMTSNKLEYQERKAGYEFEPTVGHAYTCVIKGPLFSLDFVQQITYVIGSDGGVVMAGYMLKTEEFEAAEAWLTELYGPATFDGPDSRFILPEKVHNVNVGIDEETFRQWILPLADGQVVSIVAWTYHSGLYGTGIRYSIYDAETVDQALAEASSN